MRTTFTPQPSESVGDLHQGALASIAETAFLLGFIANKPMLTRNINLTSEQNALLDEPVASVRR